MFNVPDWGMQDTDMIPIGKWYCSMFNVLDWGYRHDSNRKMIHNKVLGGNVQC